ncbi:MAG: nitrate reductase associated protein [Phenylobacterium sp.]
MSHTRLFAFESDFVASLRCVPMTVRMKLDACAIKLTLRQWSRFTVEDRRDLLLTPCATAAEIAAYRGKLIGLIACRAGEAARPLAEPAPDLSRTARGTPAAVRAQAADKNVLPPTDAAWRRLTDLERFVLLKLSRDKHDNINFVPALREFGLLD